MDISRETLNAVLITAGVMAFVFVAVAFIVRRVSRRRFGASATPAEPQRHSGCGGNCGCQCSPPKGPGCIPALECTTPYAHPVALHGLSCNPADPTFTYSGDAQSIVDAMNKRREVERQAQSLERLKETVAWMESQKA